MDAEPFYLKNGYRPCELVARGPNHEVYERVAVEDYESNKGLQQELLRKYGCTEANFNLEKPL